MYGSYLFFQFLARTLSPGLIGQIWNQTLSEPDQVKAVDEVIPGGFHQQWPQFAKLLWNQDPVNINSFDMWDALKLSPNLQGGGTIANVTMGGADHATWVMNGNIKHLSTFYYQFRFSDPNVRSVIFKNHPFAGLGTPGGDQVSTQAFFKKEGGIWQYEHWSDEGPGQEAFKSFCLDVKAERLVGLVIAMSNNDPSADVTALSGDLQPQLAVSSVGCWQYKGTTTVDQNFTSPTGTSTMKADAAVTFTRYRTAAAPNGVPGSEIFVVDNGTLTGDSTQVTGPCTVTQHGNGSIPAGVLSGTLQVSLGLDTGDPGMAARTIFGFGIGNVQTRGASATAMSILSL